MPSNKKPVEERRAPLDYAKKEELIAVAIRNLDAFTTLYELLTIKQVERFSVPLALVWRTVREFHKRYAELPDKTLLISDLHHAISESPKLIDEDEAIELDKFIEYAWDDKEHGKDISKSAKHARVAIETGRQLLEEHVAQDSQIRLTTDGTLPVNLPQVYDEARAKLDQVQALSSTDIGLPFPEGWDNRQERKLITTGLAPLDAFAGGGWRGGDAFLFMGPYGSNKTTACCHAVASLIKVAERMLVTGDVRRDKKGRPMTPVVVLIFTESDADEYRDRLLSNIAKVPWKRLAAMSSIDSLCNAPTAASIPETQYERRKLREAVDDPLIAWEHEQMRVRNAVQLANKYLILIDCTDAENSKRQIGAGGILEVANVIGGIFRKRKDHYPIAFWLDHVSGLVDRQALAQDLDDSGVRRVLMNLPRQAVDKIGKPFNAPIGLMHQFSGAANAKASATARFHHTDSEGCKAIAKYATFAFVTGPVDKKQLCVWDCTKHRREPPTAYRIIRVVGSYNEIRDRTGKYTVDTARRTIMRKSEATSYGAIRSNQVVDEEIVGGIRNIGASAPGEQQ